MPAQALIRKLDRATINTAITKLNAGDLLDVIERPGGAHLVRCKPLEKGSVAGSADALQALCDMDAKIVRQEEAEAAKKAAEDKKPPTP